MFPFLASIFASIVSFFWIKAGSACSFSLLFGKPFASIIKFQFWGISHPNDVA
jgi:hypothetical protein